MPDLIATYQRRGHAKKRNSYTFRPCSVQACYVKTMLFLYLDLIQNISPVSGHLLLGAREDYLPSSFHKAISESEGARSLRVIPNRFDRQLLD